MSYVDGVTLGIADLERSVAWYRSIGIDVGSPTRGRRSVTATPVAGHRIVWEVVDDAQGDRVRPGIRLALRCATTAAVDETVARLRRAGTPVLVPPHDAAWGARTADVVDPDGHVVEIYAPYP